MLAIYASTALILLASLLIGRAILALLGWPRAGATPALGAMPAWLSGAVGFAALVTVTPFLLRLPGRATTTAILLGLLLIAAAAVVWRDPERGRPDWPAAATVVIVVALASIPFLVNDRVGVLGEGIYTNDHAAQLYWSDWLQHGFGPEPSAVRFGYPIGPQAVAVVAAQATGTSLVSAFNGLLLAIPALTALTALGALAGMPTSRRIAIASITGLPYLAASFLAQSAFKETSMALLVLAFALVLQTASRTEADAEPRPPWRVVVAVCLLLAAAGVFTFSVPGLAWFVFAIPLWLALEAIAGRSPIDWRAVRDGVAAHKVTLVVATVIVIGIAALVFGPAREFASKVGDVQNSFGRLSSPVFPGEALGIWPAGDFRIVRGEVSGALFAVALGAVAAGYGVVSLWRRRQFALLAMLIAGAAVYLGTRAVAEIHVQAKALAVIAPLVLLVGLRALLAPGPGAARGDWRVLARYALGALVLVAATASTLLALRDTPIADDGRQLELERLAERAAGEPVAFLGVDRFAGYYLRGTLARAPAGYVPEEIDARPEKRWQQGDAADFDSLDSGQLDKFDYAITTTAAYASAPPPNFEPVAGDGDYVLWQRDGDTPRSRVLQGEDGAPAANLDCDELGRRPGIALLLAPTSFVPYTDWRLPPLVEHAAGGQERAFEAPGEASATIPLPGPGAYELSLQYHSQVSLEVVVDDEVVAELPPSLDGMYLSGAGRGAFWPAGEATGDGGSLDVVVRAAEPGGLADLVGAPRRVWLGGLAATRAVATRTVPLDRACGEEVDHFTFQRSKG